jgi:hypothetical protein
MAMQTTEHAVADALHDAWLDLRHKEQIWRSACATFDHVHSAGNESAAIVRGFAGRFKMDDQSTLSSQEANAVKDLMDAKAAIAIATHAEIAARESLIAVDREYKNLELLWAERALINFQSSWSRTRLEQGRRG